MNTLYDETFVEDIRNNLREREKMKEKEMAKIAKNDPDACSFCGQGREAVKKIIAGPNVYICDECVLLCEEIIENEVEGKSSIIRKDLDKWQKGIEASIREKLVKKSMKKNRERKSYMSLHKNAGSIL